MPDPKITVMPSGNKGATVTVTKNTGPNTTIKGTVNIPMGSGGKPSGGIRFTHNF